MESNRKKLVFRFRRRMSKFCLTLALGSFLCLTSAAVYEVFEAGGDSEYSGYANVKTAREIRVEKRAKVIQVVLFVVGGGVLAFSAIGFFVFWRCPHCDSSLGGSILPNYCPRCSWPLDVKN